jgi:hypothetical protein
MMQLIRYDAMCHAIAQAYEIDEVKDLRDKAVAIEAYARQAKNVEAERQACEIRLRAERKWGQLYKASEKAKGSPGNQHTGPLARDEGSKTLFDMGVSYDQSSRWQDLAEVDDETFEEEVVKPGASTTGILNGQKKQHPVDLVQEEALWLWGRLRDFRRDGILDEDPAAICQTMLPHMRVTLRELLPLVIDWLRKVQP